MDWILANLPLVGAIAAFLFAAWRAHKAGTLNQFLAKQLEPRVDKADKDSIKDAAGEAGLQGLLDAVVKKAGLKKGSAPPAP